jgi:hypothetical protein
VARFVLLRIEDNDHANDFVHALKHGDIIFSSKVPDTENDIRYVSLTAEPTAMYADPTKLCECHKSYERPNRKEPMAGLNCGLVMSANYGWTLCPKCNKPHGFQVQHPKNLLVPGETPKTRQYYLGFKADRSQISGSKEG